MSTLPQTLDGDLAFGPVVRDAATCAAQKLNALFRFFQGEWFLNTLEGVPYFSLVLGIKNPNLGVIRTLFRNVILSVQGVRTIDELSLDFNRAVRDLKWSARVGIEGGATIIGGAGTPFQVAQ